MLCLNCWKQQPNCKSQKSFLSKKTLRRYQTAPSFKSEIGQEVLLDVPEAEKKRVISDILLPLNLSNHLVEMLKLQVVHKPARAN